MEDLGEVSVILGMSITHNRNLHSNSLCQQGYIDSLLASYKMSNCKAIASPLKPGTQLSPASPQ